MHRVPGCKLIIMYQHSLSPCIQTREEGKSVMAEVQRLRSISESAERSRGVADLATTFELDQEISPIT